MVLTLQLINETTLPDGGPVSISINGERGIDIGRAPHLDWTLPDPTRYISSKHCEIRYKDGDYWLHDVSTNGTFLNGADHRIHAPHRLRNGDQFTIGHYIVAVTVDSAKRPVEEDVIGASASAVHDASGQELWADVSAPAPAIDPKQLRPALDLAPVHPDFLDWAADIPDPFGPSSQNMPALATKPLAAHVPSEMDWTAKDSSLSALPPHSPTTSPLAREPERQTDTNGIWQDAPSNLKPARSVSAGKESDVEELLPYSSTESVSCAAFIRRLADSAGLSADVLGDIKPADLAQQIGVSLRLLTENLMQLLSARQQAKGLARSSNHTMVEATDNNPLKFSPSSQAALAIMFGPANGAYLDAHRAILQAFDDLKGHQVQTYTAMQHALASLVEELDPIKIEHETKRPVGIWNLFRSRNAKLWETYKARWEAKIGRKGGGPIEAFMQYFAEYYDRSGG
jgi:type VI secretion system protein ImpI